MCQKPTVADLRQAAQKLGMNPGDTYLNAVEQIITLLANAYATLAIRPSEVVRVLKFFLNPGASRRPSFLFERFERSSVAEASLPRSRLWRTTCAPILAGQCGDKFSRSVKYI
jgi:hypothetical protein